MLFFLGYVYLSLVQWYWQRTRRQMYYNAIRQATYRSSILIQRAGMAQGGSVGALLRSQLLNCSTSYKERKVMKDEHISISAVEPKQRVVLHRWTSYLDLHPANMDHHSSVMVLLEAERVPDADKFNRDAQQTMPTNSVHVLQLGCPIAWKPGNHFGIILHCSLDDFVALCDAFGQGRLTMGEDLQLDRIITVKTEGRPQSLLQNGQQAFDFSTEATQQQGSAEASVSDKVARSPHRTENPPEKVQSKDRELDLPKPTSPSSILKPVPKKLFSEGKTVKKNSIPVDSKTVKTDAVNGVSNNNAVNGVNGTNSPKSASKTAVNGSADSRGSELVDGVVGNGHSIKPPNILVYCGKKDSTRKFEAVKATLELSVNTDCYTLYHLKHDMVNSTPWEDNTALLLVSTEHLYDEVATKFSDYVRRGGKLVSFGSTLENYFVERKETQRIVTLTQASVDKWEVNTMRGRHSYLEDLVKVPDVVMEVVAKDRNTSEPVIVLLRHSSAPGEGVALFSQLYLEKDPTEMAIDPETFSRLKNSNTSRLEAVRHLLSLLGINCTPQAPPTLTPGILVAKTKEKKLAFQKSIHRRLTEKGILKSRATALQFLESDMDASAVPEKLPIISGDEQPEPKFFCVADYIQNLKTQVLGQVLIYVDVVPTTMSLFDGMIFALPEDVGVVAIAGRQTAGRGRGGNSWLSPPGCAMFSLHVRVPLHTQLGERVSFLQHIVSLAVVQSVNKIPGYEGIDLRLKWPNDIYYGGDMKLGGVIVTSSIMNDSVHAIIGCGFNVSNSNPTICINDIIKQYNQQHSTSLAPLSTAELIARTISSIEELINDFQKDGRQGFCQMYYQRWLHGGTTVRLEREGLEEEVTTVRGLDDYGYLEVESASGEVISVQPDGNSFDMMRNLITIKRR